MTFDFITTLTSSVVRVSEGKFNEYVVFDNL